MEKWLSASEIAKMGLPGLPATKVAIASRAAREGWPVKGETGLGGQRKVYQIPEAYLVRRAESRDATKQVYDPTMGSGGMLKAATDYVDEARKHGDVSDAELIREIVLGVERWLEKNGAHPDAERKAALISLLFRYFQTDGALDTEKMDQLLRAVA